MKQLSEPTSKASSSSSTLGELRIPVRAVPRGSNGSTTTCSVPLISVRQKGQPCPSESSKQQTHSFVVNRSSLNQQVIIIIIIITGSAVALHCCKAHAKINGKIENSTPCKIVTHEDFNLKLGTRDYVAEATHHATLGSNRPSGGFPPNRGNITPM